MTETTCRWGGSDRPRWVPKRHADDCDRDTCPGCQPCTEAHCRICHRAHIPESASGYGTCAECLAEARGNLREIARLCDALPIEVEHRGVNGEAMMLLGPSADPEARGHLEASVAAGRIPADYLDDADHELHPLFVLGTWDMVYRDALDHDERADDQRITIANATDYLDRNLTYVAGYEHVPFEDVARDLRRCVAHLEDVLHDGEQIDEGVPCMTCGRPLRRVWGDGKRDDGWTCVRCHEDSTDDQYRLAVKSDYIQHAEWLTDADMAYRFAEYGIQPATVRSWATDKPGRPATVRKKRHTERTVYAVEDVARKFSDEPAA